MTPDPIRARDPGAAAPSERTSRPLFVFFVIVLALAAGGFVYKMVAFAHTLHAAPDVSFALMPMVTYMTVATGFFCLLAWSILNGHLRDLEGPKRFLLENERALDAAVEADLARERAASEADAPTRRA